MAEIIVDYREDKKIVRELYKQKIDVEVKSLISADFVMQIKDIDGHVKDLGIERKSVTADTPIIIKKDDEIKIIEIKKAYDIFKQGGKLEVMGLNFNNKEINWFKVYDVTKHKSSHVYRLSTSPKIKKKYKNEEKSTIKLTGGHNVYLFRNREILCLPTSEIIKGDYLILIPPKLKENFRRPYGSFKKFLEEVQSDSIKNFKIFKNEFKLGSGQNKYKIPKFDKNFFFTLGMWVAEGRYGEGDHKGVIFFQKDKLRNKIMEKYLKKVFGKFMKGFDYYSAGGKVYYKLFSDKLKLKHGAENKIVPSIVFNAPNRLKAEFIKGYLFGDGYRNLNIKRRNPQLAASSKSKLLIVGLSYLLYSLGLENSVHEEYKTYKGKRNKYYLIRIKTISLKDFIKKVGQIPSKNLKFKDGVSTKIPFYLGISLNQNLIKLNKEEIKFLYEDLENLNNGKSKDKIILFKILKKLKVNEKPLDEIYKFLRERIGIDSLFLLNKIYQNEVFLSRIYDIEKINFSEKVYDFSVENSENFVGGLIPILLHNTIHDFLNSIIDKRILTQLIALKENFPLQLLIIEGEENIYKIRNFHPNSIRGMLSSIAIDYQIPILYTKNYRDTAAYLALIARRLEKPKRHISLISKRKPLTLREQQEYIIEGLPKIGPSLAKSLLKKFKSVKNVINAKEDKLKKVEKIGDKKSKLIREVLDSKYKE